MGTENSEKYDAELLAIVVPETVVKAESGDQVGWEDYVKYFVDVGTPNTRNSGHDEAYNEPVAGAEEEAWAERKAETDKLGSEMDDSWLFGDVLSYVPWDRVSNCATQDEIYHWLSFQKCVKVFILRVDHGETGVVLHVDQHRSHKKLSMGHFCGEKRVNVVHNSVGQGHVQKSVNQSEPNKSQNRPKIFFLKIFFTRREY